MRRRIPSLSLSLFVAATALAACATFGADVQRTTQGPTADEVWTARFVQGYGRLPTFDEQVTWKDGFETRILAFLSRRPEVATSPRASQLRFERRVIVGMNKDEVVALLEQPDAVTSEVATMRTAAGRFWEPIAPRAKEMWSYSPGWRLYFDGDQLADVVVAGRSALD
jgi:predicted small secreted protein